MVKGKLCGMCGKQTTRHPSGLCARCQRKADIPMKLCKCCESRRTRDESGLCYRCKIKKGSQDYGVSRIAEARKKCELTLRILELKEQGLSLRKIGTELNIPKSTVANTFFAAVYSGSRGNTFNFNAADRDSICKIPDLT